MNAYDVRLTSISTVEWGVNSNVSNVMPNAIGGRAAPTFDVVIEGAAGGNLGYSRLPYTLAIIAYSITNGANVDALNPVIPPQSFDAPIWTPIGGSRGDFRMRQQFTVFVGAHQNQILKYSAVLFNTDMGIVSFIESEPFLLV